MQKQEGIRPIASLSSKKLLISYIKILTLRDTNKSLKDSINKKKILPEKCKKLGNS